MSIECLYGKTGGDGLGHVPGLRRGRGTIEYDSETTEYIDEECPKVCLQIFDQSGDGLDDSSAWERAVEFSQRILKEDKEDTDSSDKVLLYKAPPQDIRFWCSANEDVEFAVNADSVEEAFQKVQEFIALIKAVDFEYYVPGDKEEDCEEEDCEEEQPALA